ncbi:MAG: hypothetical protein U1D99_01120 [Candidatus Omnitrophota bacterium]|nr:hypothetical protein [Candidatus Omnitrophota bacterium]
MIHSPLRAASAQNPHGFMGEGGDPHAFLNMADPHAFLNMEDPHAFMNTEDPHAFMKEMPGMGMDMPPGQSEALLASAKKDLPISWTAPEGWQELPGSGFRLATFKAGAGDDAVECSIVSLAGPAGGIDANIARWMGQIKVEPPPSGSIIEFLKKNNALESGEKTASGLPILYVDLGKLQAGAPDTTPTISAAIIETEGATVFVKITGPLQAVTAQQALFRALGRSINVKK